jgi:hypothetical protein
MDPTPNIDFESWDLLCRDGALSGFAQDVMGACERAVMISPSDLKDGLQDSRGLAKAMVGDYSGAIEDFKAFVEWSKSNNMYEKYGQKREEWIKALEAGKNPFDAKTPEALRQK